jgi:TonB-dependent SusC/RagA subfamily outer membrane receptor
MVEPRFQARGSAKPIPHGHVTVEGLLIEDLVRPDGVFVLHVPIREVTLLIEAEGYLARDVVVPVDQEVAIVALQPVGFELEEITVTGVDRRHLATSAERVSGADVNRVPAASLEQALQGKVPGADVQSNSGTPGGDLQLRLRGVTSILGSVQPLYVLDGVVLSNAAVPVSTSTVTGGEDFIPSRIADLNPYDIASIEILKGAAATTLYGSKGSNGVVIIKTKRGRRIP